MRSHPAILDRPPSYYALVMQRRAFVGSVFAGLGITGLGAKPPRPKAGDLPMRVLGRTGQKLTVIGMGGARFHLVPFDEGKAVTLRAYSLGINYFDMARAYWGGRAEEVYGAVLPPFRKHVFLTTKTGKRTRAEAEAELDLSLKTLNTDYVDLWQMHSVGEKGNGKEEIARILGPGGAMEAFEAAKKAGKCRFIGFTGHYDPEVNVELLRAAGDRFDTVLMPLYIADPLRRSFEGTALPVVRERGLGVLGMKIFANAFLLRQFSVSDCLRYTLSLPVTATPLGFCTQGQLEDDVRVAQRFTPLTPEDMAALRKRAEGLNPTFEYWKRT